VEYNSRFYTKQNKNKGKLEKPQITVSELPTKTGMAVPYCNWFETRLLF